MFFGFIINGLDSKRSPAFQGMVYLSVFVFSAVVSALPLLFEGVQRSVDSHTFMVCAERFLEQDTPIKSL